MNNNSIYNGIISKLRATRRKETLLIIGTGLFNALAIFFLVFFVAIFIESFAHGDETFRGILYGISLFTLIASLGVLLVPGVSRFVAPRRRPSLEVIALRVGNHYPEVKDRLCNAVQIYKSIDKPQGMSRELIEAAFEQITSYSKDKNFDAILETNRFKKSLLFFILSVVLFFGSIFIFPSHLGASLERVNNWDKSYLPPAPFTISISEANQTVLRGSPAKIIIEGSGTPPETIKLLVKEEKQEVFDEYVLRIDDNNQYSFEIAATRNTIEFYASAQWLTSNIITELAKINVIDIPQIRSLSGNITFPAYTQLSPREFDEMSADINALTGSNVQLRLSSNKELKEAFIVLEKNIFASNDQGEVVKSDTARITMNISGNQASGNFRVNFNGTYHVELIDVHNQTNPDPIKYTVVSGNDGYPTITLLQPLMNVEVSKDAILPMRIAIGDDYGFKGLNLHFRMTESKYSPAWSNFRTIPIPIVSSSVIQEIPYVWNLNTIGITPEDIYEFYLEVFDNDIVSGPKSSRTQTLTLRLPSLDEVVRQADAIHEKVDKELEKIFKESETLRKEIEELNRELLKKNNQKELNWKERRKAEEIMKKQNELKERLAQVSNDIENATNRLQENNLMSPETLQKYMELQKLMQEVDSPELKRMQQQMEQAMQNMSQEQMQKAMQEMQFDEEKFRKSIERTMKILKRIQAEQKADALAKRAEELERRQNELNHEMNNTNPADNAKRDELARKQEMLNDELAAINKDLKELEKLMKDIGENEMPMSELQQAQESLNFDETQSDMSEASSAMQEGDFNKANKSQKKSSNSIKQFAQQMKNLKQKMQERVSEEAIRQMQKALNDMLETSRNQEDLRNRTQRSDFNSTQIPEFAQQQANELESMMNIANSMMELGNKSFAVTSQMGVEMANAMTHMRNAVDFLANRQINQAANAQLQSMRSMNSTIGQMQSMVSQMQNQSSACDQGGGEGGGQGQGGQGGSMSFQQRMQQLAAQQQAINQSLQQMATGEGDSMPQEQRAQMSRLAERQGDAQKTAEDLANEQKNLATQENRLKSDLNHISREMQEVAHDIRNNKVTEETKRKQERILSRLLDATKSLHDRDFEQQKQGREGRDYSRQGPSAAEFESMINRNQMLQDFLRNVRQGYSKDYEQLIRRYFESMRQPTNTN